MKKVSSILIAAILVAVSMVSVFAAGINEAEQSVLDEVKTSVTVNGTEYVWPDSFINQAENYFNTVDLTAEQAETMVAAHKEGKTTVSTNGVVDFEKADTSVKQSLLDTLNKAAVAIGGTATYDRTSREVTVTDGEGQVILKVVPTLVAKTTGQSVDKTTDGGVVKTTGSAANTVAIVVISIAAAVVIAGGVVFVIKKRA